MLADTRRLSDIEFREAAETALARSARIDDERQRFAPITDQSWYVVRSVGKSDQQALDWLKRLEIETYYPKVIQMKRVPRRQLSSQQRQSGIEIRKPQLGPLFPRYIFARFGMARVGWREVFKTAGLGGMLCEGDLPVRMSEKLINSIKSRESDGAIPGTEKTRVVFGIGDELLVTDGPFASFPGIVEKGIDVALEDLDPETRIKVAVNIFGRATPVELEVWQVTKR